MMDAHKSESHVETLEKLELWIAVLSLHKRVSAESHLVQTMVFPDT